MKGIILIKYGELTTKKDNRKYFINLLCNNIEEKLKSFDVVITKEHSRMYVQYDKTFEKDIIRELKTTFGIHAFSIVYRVETDTDLICKEVLKKFKEEKFKTFKV